jgi:hypothetical protein
MPKKVFEGILMTFKGILNTSYKQLCCSAKSCMLVDEAECHQVEEFAHDIVLRLMEKPWCPLIDLEK